MELPRAGREPACGQGVKNGKHPGALIEVGRARARWGAAVARRVLKPGPDWPNSWVK